MKTFKYLIRRAKSINCNFLVPYFELLQFSPNLINDFIVYDGERTVLSMTSDIELIEGLLQNGANLTMPAFSSKRKYKSKYNQYSYLTIDAKPTNAHYFCYTNRLDIIKYLIKNNLLDVNLKDPNKNTLLHYAVINRVCALDGVSRLELAMYLISNGANINSLNDRFLTPMSGIPVEFQEEAYIKLTNI